MSEVLIAKGRCGRVYKFSENSNTFVRKELHPSFLAKAWNKFFYKSSHPLSTEAGCHFTYHKRRLAHRLCAYLDNNIHITDALQLSPRGFISPFVDGHRPSKKERHAVYSATKKLEDFFDSIGMPTWSFSQKNPFSGSNLILQENKMYIVDYEQSVPIPDSKGHMGYDTIYFDDLRKFINSNKQRILERLGSQETHHLEEALEGAYAYYNQLEIKPRALARFEEKVSRALNMREVDKIIEELCREGKISEAELHEYREGTTGENIRLSTMNLAVHCVIGLGTPAYIFTPLSAMLRLLWTGANFLYYTLLGDYIKRRIHSPRVMFVAALPLPFPLSAISNGAYLLSIMNENPQIGLAMGDNLMREFTNKGLEENMHWIGSKKFMRSLLKGYDKFSHVSFVEGLQKVVWGCNAKKAHDILLGYLLEGAKIRKVHVA